MSKYLLALVLIITLCSAEWLSTPLTNPNGTVTFDDLGLNEVLSTTQQIPTLAPSINFQKVFTPRANWCDIWFRTFGFEEYGWFSDETWADLPNEKPGRFAELYNDRVVIFQFSVPINAISMKINSMTPTTLGIQFINGTNTSAIVPQLSGKNKFAYFGYRSEMKFNQISLQAQPTTQMDSWYVDDIQWIQCPTNQRLRGDICEDYCVSVTCGMHASCDSSSGAAVCRCNAGYEGDGTTCQDIDECSRVTSPCSANAYCNNTEGSFTCTCQPGFEGDGFNCTDIDECSLDQSPCSSLTSCNNTAGSFMCTCNQGYAGDGVQCSDIDECSLVPSPCDASAVCNNTEGSFECTCHKGFTGDGLTCEDIDECSLEKSPCSSVASCNNTVGSFTCTCQEGYSGNGIGADGCHVIVSPTSTDPPVQAPTVVTTPHANSTPIRVTSPSQVASGVVSSGNQLLWTGVATMGLMCSFIGAL